MLGKPTKQFMCIWKFAMYGRWAEKRKDHAHLFYWAFLYNCCDKISLGYPIPSFVFQLDSRSSWIGAISILLSADTQTDGWSWLDQLRRMDMARSTRTQNTYILVGI